MNKPNTIITALHNISNWKRIINRQGNNTHVDKPKVKSVKKKWGGRGQHGQNLKHILIYVHFTSLNLTYVSILSRELRDVLLNRWARPRITRTMTSRICRDWTIKSTSFSLSTTILNRRWSFRNSSTCHKSQSWV